MIDIKILREDPSKMKERIARKGANPDLVDKILEADSKRCESLAELEDAQSKLNKFSKEIAELHGQQKIDSIKEAGNYSTKVSELKPRVAGLEEEFKSNLLLIPNPPSDDVIDGASDKDNTTNRTWGEPTKFDFESLDYLELAKKHDLLDIERGVKVAGSRSYYVKRELALLEFAIIQYALETLTAEGFVPMITPVLLNRKIMEGSGYIPQGEDEIYKTQDDTYLAGTAEQPLAGYHMDDIIMEKALPLRYVGFSSCFRREAGSYGKDVKGILRVHQFDKVEMFSYTMPEESAKEHEYLVSLEEKLMQGLKIPYQVVNICAGDLGAPAAKKFDIEAWMPSENKYRETHSCSNCTDFQARRLNIRFKNKEDKIEYAHTLNGTAFAIPRLLIAILENFQQKDGSIEIPEVLHKYLNFKKIGK